MEELGAFLHRTDKAVFFTHGSVDMATVEDTLEVGCLHVGLIAIRNIKSAKKGGMGEFFGLTPQHRPYCNITLGVR